MKNTGNNLVEKKAYFYKKFKASFIHDEFLAIGKNSTR